MERIPINSINLVSIGYDAQWKILEIEFYNGSIYHYFDVPEIIYKSLMNASSHDRYFDINIGKANYPFRRIG